MSTEAEKTKRNKRIQATSRAINRQVRIRKHYTGRYALEPVSEPHRYHKQSSMNCGRSDCAMCGNPRKFFNERTIQERRAMQHTYNI